ncbi:hypothetical protein STZ1_11061 [Bacillus subtilis]
MDSQVLDIIKKAYILGMVNKDNRLLRNEAKTIPSIKIGCCFVY